MNQHHKYFLEMAKHVASRSKDPSTKTGAVIVDHKGSVVSTGFNGFPRFMHDAPNLYADREEKYSRIVHCEMNALIFAQRDLFDCRLYTWPFMSCDRCAVHMLQAGIMEFIAPVNKAERWQESFKKTRKYIDECNAILTEIDFPTE